MSERTTRARIALAAPIAAIALACWAPHAQASAVWISPLDLGPASASPLPDVAMNRAGDAAAVWVGSTGIAQLAVRPAGGSFGTATDLSPVGQTAVNPHVAMSESGDAVAVWQFGPTATVQAAVRTAAGSLQPVQSLSVAGQDAREPQVAIDPAGNAVVVWIRGSDIVQASIRPAGAGFAGPFDLTLPAEGALAPQVAMDAAGNAVVVWTNTSNRVRAAMRRAGLSFAGASFSPTTTVSNDTLGAFNPQVAMNAGGDAVAVWQRNVTGVGNQEVHAATSVGGRAFGPVTAASPSGQTLSSPQVGLSGAGDAIAVWQRAVGVNNFVQSALRPAGGAFAARADLPSSGPIPQSPKPQIAVNDAGDAIAAWQGSTGSNIIVQAAARAAGGVFSSSLSPSNVSVAGQDAKPPQVAIDQDGDGIAVWVRNNAAQFAGYDAAGPQLRGLAGPDTAVAGTTTSWSVSPLDVWSPVEETSWNFGDGNLATIPITSHVFGTPGSYTVTVTSRDTAGNSRSASRTINVTAAPPPPPPPPPDADGDGFPATVDCNDHNKAIHPGAVDKPGNKIDEDCKNGDAAFPLLGSLVRARWVAFKHFTVFDVLFVESAKSGSTIRFTCTGKGCRVKRKTRKVVKNRKRQDIVAYVRNAHLRPGARLQIRVTKPNTLGVVRTLTVRSGKRDPKSLERCLIPGKTTPVKCPI